jgi:hypothetical protein
VSTYNFLTVKDTGPDSGCSGMPFPFDEDTPADTTYYPLSLPLGETTTPGADPNVTDASIARWGWRARRWTLTTNAAASDGTTPVSFPGGELTDFSFRTDETEIVLVGYGAQLHSVSAGAASFGFELFGDPAPPCWLDGADYKPQIDLTGTLSISDGGGNVGLVEFSTRTVNLSNPPTSSFTGTIDGVSVTIYVYAASSGAGSASMSTFALDPTTFWGWDGKFDTATGGYI